MYEQILFQRFQGALSQDQIRGPKRSQDKQLCRLPATRDRGDQIERRMVCPVEILKNKDQRLVLSDHFQRFAQLAHHATARRSENLSSESGVLVRSDERGQLKYPRRRVLSKGVDDISS